MCRIKSHPQPLLHLSTSHSSIWKPSQLSDAADAQLAYMFHPRHIVQLSDLTPNHLQSHVDMTCVVIWAGHPISGEILHPNPFLIDLHYLPHASYCAKFVLGNVHLV